jgi:putative transcriptional regulator
MSAHLDDRLADFVLGTVAGVERDMLERHVADCPRCAAEVADLAEALGPLATISAPIAPSPSARARLLTAAAGDRVGAMRDRLAGFFDLTVEKTDSIITRLADPAAWEQGPLPFVSLFHLEAGPRWAGADAGFVRFTRGTGFPTHRHLGEERVLLVEGSLIESDGTVLRPGDLRVMPAGSTHSFAIPPDEDTVYALVLHKGIEIV